jgi:hypothetical protein
MSNVQLYAVNSDDETVLIQLSDDSPVKITLSVAELNPFTPASFFSQTFRVPGLGPNVQFFNDVYSVNGASFNPAAAAQAWILQDGTLFSVGNINLQSVYTNDFTGLIEYEIYFLGDTSNLSTSIGEGGMNTIDASELNHTLSYANVTGSWAATGGATAGLKDGNVLYPLIEWGYTYGTGGTNKNLPIQNTLSNQYSESFTIGATSALLMEQMKPATRVKWLWDKILSDAGYTYDSTFLDSDLFQSLYFVSDSVARPYFPISTGNCEATVANDFLVPVGTTLLVPYNTIITNNSQSFNPSTHIWTAPSTGTFYFEVGGSVQLNPFYPLPEAAWRVGYYINDILVNLSPILTTTGYSPDYRNWSRLLNAVSLNKGDTVSVKIEQMSFGNSDAVFYDNGFRCTIGPNQVTMSSFLPDDSILKKIDFIRGIIRMFNLVLEPSRTVQKSFIIEPWIDWIQLGEVKDWTRFYDGSADLQSSPVFFEQQRILKFQGKNDADWLNKTVQDQTKADYLYRQYDSEIRLIKGDQDIEVPFAGVPMQSIPSKVTQYPNWVFPSLGRIQSGDTDQPGAGKMEPIIPIPRIVFYNGLQSNPVNWYLSNVVESSTNGVAQSTYPLVSPYSSWPPDLYNTLNLNFLSKQQTWSTASTYIGQTANDLYTRYWSDYVDWLYDPYNRKVNLTLRLDPADILELSFNDKIWIKDTWYFVQKITDYPIGDIDLLKCELVKVPLAAIPGPIPSPATGGTAGTTCRTISLCNNNVASITGQATYTYVDCESNLASITLLDSSCASPICMLFPVVNPLPSGFTAFDSGACGVTGSPLTLQIKNEVVSVLIESPITTVEVQGASGGTGGTYTTIQNFTFNGDQEQDFFAIVPNVPTGFGLKVILSSSYAPGTALVSQEISLATNGVTGATAARSGTYQPISAIFPAVVNPSDTYTAYVNITY